MQKRWIPNKVTWMVDLANPVEKRFPTKVLGRIASEKYQEKIGAQVMSADKIGEKFSPLYEKLMMGRADFRLNPEETRKKIEAIARDDEYRLVWFADSLAGKSLGGIVIHLLHDQVRVAYRCFDHILAKELGFSELDYYAEIRLGDLAEEMKYRWLCHGNDHHPVSQVGLSMFKLRIGAKPMVSTGAKNLMFGPEQLDELLKIGGVAGYYADPVAGFYTRFHLYVNGTTGGVVQSFLRVAERAEIAVIREGREGD